MSVRHKIRTETGEKEIPPRRKSPAELAGDECCNYISGGGCVGIGIRNNLEPHPLGMGGRCVVVQKPAGGCSFFLECVAPSQSIPPDGCADCGESRKPGHKYCDSCGRKRRKARERQKKSRQRSSAGSLSPVLA